MKPEDLMASFIQALENKLSDKENLTAADLNVVRQFLKDHDVSWETSEVAKVAVEGVLAKLPSFDDDGNVIPMRNS